MRAQLEEPEAEHGTHARKMLQVELALPANELPLRLRENGEGRKPLDAADLE